MGEAPGGFFLAEEKTGKRGERKAPCSNLWRSRTKIYGLVIGKAKSKGGTWNGLSADFLRAQLSALIFGASGNRKSIVYRKKSPTEGQLVADAII